MIGSGVRRLREPGHETEPLGVASQECLRPGQALVERGLLLRGYCETEGGANEY